MRITYGFKINCGRRPAQCLVPRICESPSSSGLGAFVSSWSPAGTEEPNTWPAAAVLLALRAECRLCFASASASASIQPAEARGQQPVD